MTNLSPKSTMGLAKRVGLGAAVFAFVHCSGNRGPGILVGTDNASESKKGDALGTTDGDDADTSAPVSGAYLTCFVPPSKPGETKKYAGCNAVDKDGKPIPPAAFSKLKWGYVAAKNKIGKRPIKVYDLHKSKDKFKFGAIYEIELPGAGQSRVDVGKYFLGSGPVLERKVKAPTPKPGASGLNLTVESISTFATQQVKNAQLFPATTNVFANERDPNLSASGFDGVVNSPSSGVEYQGDGQATVYSGQSGDIGGQPYGACLALQGAVCTAPPPDPAPENQGGDPEFYPPEYNTEWGGGENPGGENPGGENPGGENPGGENPGGENPGGENPNPILLRHQP